MGQYTSINRYSIMKYTKLGLCISIIFATSGVQAAPVLSGTLNDQTIFSNTSVTTGASLGNQTVWGSILANDDVTLGAGAKVSGNSRSKNLAIGAGVLISANTITVGNTSVGANAIVGGDVTATFLTVGADATISGNVVTVANSTFGASAMVSGDVQSGGSVTIGGNATVIGTVQHGTALVVAASASIGEATNNTTPPPAIINADEHQGVSDAQSALGAMLGATGLAAGNIASDTIFVPGVYDVTGLLTMTAGITITLDAQGQDSAFIFNVSNYLTFGAGTVIEVINGNANTSVVWNVGGYTSIGANAEIIGTVLAEAYVIAGAYATVSGSGDSCGGVFSATSYVTVGANATVGGEGCKGAINNIMNNDGVAEYSVPVVLEGAFPECPARAFLTQDAVAKTYSVNLVTGDFGLLQNDMGTRSKVSATGFNPNDNFLYGWGYEQHKPVRINNEFKVEYLEVEGIPDGLDFSVGDVSGTNNTYYVYRRGSSNGLYGISLDSGSADYLEMKRVIGSETLSLDIYDIAFHPTDGFAYAVDRSGKLHKINVETGGSEDLGSVGIEGIFGAAYFDVDANLYLSSNRNGNLYKIAIDSGSYAAQLFSIGPSSSVNDGARCALAPVVDESNVDVDFGDAPDSYGTYLENNGARHGLLVDPNLFLGSQVDGESDGKPKPLSDDTSDRNDDEDGVQFATNLQAGEDAVVIVEASKAGTLSAWIDSNQNGVFENNEQVITDKAVEAGKQSIYISIPGGASAGSTWSRFRLSSSVGVTPTGLVSDGEVEDYSVIINAAGSAVTYYPSSSGWTTVAFEDNWPFEGDYDMNDLVAQLRTSIYKTDGKITLVNISGELSAVGAAYHNGFGIRLPDVLRDQIDEDNINYTINDRVVNNYSPLEAGRYEAIFIMAYNTWSYVSAGEGCIFYRTEEGCGSDKQMRFNLTIPMKTPIESDIAGVFDPFLFATPGAWHGDHFATPPGRSYEIHLKNQHATEAFDYAMMNFSGQDASSPANKHFYQTTNGMPWALELGSDWKHPKEFRDITHAYPLFPSYVRSEGTENTSWYTEAKAVESILFKD